MDLGHFQNKRFIYSLLKLWQDIKIYKNIIIPGSRYPFVLKGLKPRGDSNPWTLINLSFFT